MGLLRFSPAQEAISAWCNPQPHETVKEPPASGALPGLANLGNTCFANSVLQCLLNTPGWLPEACLAFGQFEEATSSTKAALGRSFQQLAQEYGMTADGALQRSNSALKNMKEAIAAIDPQYAGCQQQDAYEFLGCLLEGLEEGFAALFKGVGDEKPTTNADVIRAICGVTTHIRRDCHSCKGSFEVDSVTDTALRLPLLSPAAQLDPELRQKEEETPITLEALLEAARRPEEIEGYDCDKCRECSKENGCEHVRSNITQHAGVISATRDILIVVLYRFGHALDAQGNFNPMKVKRQVAFPTDLTLESEEYRLFGAVSHVGSSLSAGHYVAAVRSRRDDMWYECNDELVTPLNLKALYDGRPVTSVRPGAEPYILFYHRKNIGSDAPKPAEAVLKEDLVAEVAAKTASAAAPAISAMLEVAARADDEPTGSGAAAEGADTAAAESAAEEEAETAGGGEDGATTGAEASGDAAPEDLGEWVLVPEGRAIAVSAANLTADADDSTAAASTDSERRSVRRPLTEPAEHKAWKRRSSSPDKSSDCEEEEAVIPPKPTSCPFWVGGLWRSFANAGTAPDFTTPTPENCMANCSAEGTGFFLDHTGYAWP